MGGEHQTFMAERSIPERPDAYPEHDMFGIYLRMDSIAGIAKISGLIILNLHF